MRASVEPCRNRVWLAILVGTADTAVHQYIGENDRMRAGALVAQPIGVACTGGKIIRPEVLPQIDFPQAKRTESPSRPL
jgi:hypothetical protein